MALADDELILRFDGERIVCRPTLRAAMRLEKRYGFNNLLKAIAEQSLSAMADLVRETSPGGYNLIQFLEAHQDFPPLNVRVVSLVQPLLSLTLALAGVSEDDLSKDDSDKSNERVSFAEHHKRLYRIGTGYLGWTPETTWNATPNEIREAYEGRLEMLRAIFGTEEKTREKSDADFVAFLKARVK